MAFPLNPTNDQQTTQNGIVYTYNSTLGVWTVLTQTPGDFGANNITATNQITSAKIAATEFVGVFPVGTKMLFQQTAAPTGWTKDTSHNNKALRVVSGTAGSGGTVAFTTAFASKAVSGSVGSTTLTEAQMPSHSHRTDSTSTPNGDWMGLSGGTEGGWGLAGGTNNQIFRLELTSAGSSQSHNHSFTGTAIDLAVQYVDMIIATKD